MNKLFRHPITNIIGISMFSAFYSIIFLVFSDLIQSQIGITTHPFWRFWDSVLIAGGHRYITYILMGLTVLIVILLFFRHKPYDEYHTAILMKCLAVSLILTLAAIAGLFVAVLLDPVGMISKFALFILIQWATIVASDLIYLLLCKSMA